MDLRSREQRDHTRWRGALRHDTRWTETRASGVFRAQACTQKASIRRTHTCTHFGQAPAFPSMVSRSCESQLEAPLCGVGILWEQCYQPAHSDSISCFFMGVSVGNSPLLCTIVTHHRR